MPKLASTEQHAAVAAIGQGQLTQIGVLAKDIFERLEALEEGASGLPPAANLDGVSQVSLPTDDAKAVNVRESLIELTEAFNGLVKALKGEANG